MQSCSRAVRLIAMLQLIRVRPNGITSRQIAEQLGVSQRTVQRDLADVQDEPLRAPLWQDEDYRWRFVERRTGGDVC